MSSYQKNLQNDLFGTQKQGRRYLVSTCWKIKQEDGKNLGNEVAWHCQTFLIGIRRTYAKKAGAFLKNRSIYVQASFRRKMMSSTEKENEKMLNFFFMYT